MKSTIYQGLYFGPGIRAGKVKLMPGILVKIAHVEVAPGYDYWEAANLKARMSDEWPKVDRLDLVIPGHETEADQLRLLLVSPLV
jgi:hypothetical protein